MDKLESVSFSHMTERNDRRFDTLGRVFSHTVIDYMNGFPQAQFTALDIGSFNGEITREIERKANETLRAHNKRLNIIGLDPLYEQTNGLPASVLAENNGSHAYISGLGEQLPFRDGSIPIVLAIDSIHHSDYPFDVIREMWRVTAAGGMIVIKDHDPDNIIRLLQAGISDVIGNTTKRSEQLTQIRTIIRTI